MQELRQTLYGVAGARAMYREPIFDGLVLPKDADHAALNLYIRGRHQYGRHF